jgi:hypothetical protein
MGKIQHFREQAQRCRALAAEQPDSRHVERWLILAKNYDQAAEQLERRLQTASSRPMQTSRITAVPFTPGKRAI